MYRMTRGEQGEFVEKTQNKKTDGARKRKLYPKGLLRSVGNIAVLLLVFWVGLSIGNGSVGFSSSTSTNKALPGDLNYGDTERVYDLLRTNYDGKLNAEKLEDGLRSGLVKAAGDPYTQYFTAKEAKEFNEQLSGTFSGIGAQLGKDDKDNVVVIAPIAGYPAEKAGLRAKDAIININGKSTAGMSLDEAVSFIRGKKDTKVTLEIMRDGSDRKEITVVRDDITIPSVEHEILPNNIGYIQITQFWNDTPELVNKAAREFKQAGVKSVVLDLRSNPGGSLPAAVDVASVWLPSGKTVLQEKRDGKVQETYKSSGAHGLLGMPTIVLINEGSASASEILAGALKDNKAATLMGTKSYGKGSVQQIIPLSDGGELKVTIARWYRPNGENIDKKGIKPDVEVKMTDEDYTKGADPQKDAAIQRLRQ